MLRRRLPDEAESPPSGSALPSSLQGGPQSVREEQLEERISAVIGEACG